MIINWGKVNSNLKWLITADENPYFDLHEFCNDNKINYTDLIGFIRIGRKIINGEINLTNKLKRELMINGKLIQQLEILTLQ